MMPGIVAINGVAGGVSGILEPFAKLDFTTANYTLGGVSVALGDLLQRTDMTINANGARFDWNTSDQPARFQNSLIDAINLHASAMTVVIECQMAADETLNHQMFYMSGDADKSQIRLKMKSTYIEFGATIDAGMNYYADYSTPRLVNTTYRAALCYSPSVSTRFDLPKIAAFNGGLTTYNDAFNASVYAPSFASGAIGGRYADSYLDMNGWIRKVEFYEIAMAEAELIAISTP